MMRIQPFRIARQFQACQSRAFSQSKESAKLSRYGLGGHRWKRFSPDKYQELIHQALSKEVTYFEVAGLEGGDIAMVGAMQRALEVTPELADCPVTVTTRLGYRTIEEGNASESKQPSLLPGDVVAAEEGSSQSQVVHNISTEYVQQSLESSPLLELQQDMKNLRLVFLVQNPEVQVLELLKESPNANQEERQEYIKQRSLPAFQTLQDYSTAKTIPGESHVSFGVVSNGLGIPREHKHPMYLDADLIIQAAKDYSSLSTVQLPANLLETQGWSMGRKLHASMRGDAQIVAMRPLTCYPDLGTGTGHPFRLVDYALPSLDGKNPYVPTFGNDEAFDLLMQNASEQTIQYTNEMTSIPPIYQIALQTAMSHFDAEHLLEVKQERKLSMEERETLDGCKLVQSMIHDLDADLENIRSFSAHEEDLYGRIIPLLYDTFEAMDDHTSDVLQAYFAAYAVAVRYAIARKTRQVLREGEDANKSGNEVTYSDIPQSMPLQEYALRHLLAEDCFDRVVIGASTMQDFKHQTQLMETIAEDDNPLDAIAKANEAEQVKANGSD